MLTTVLSDVRDNEMIIKRAADAKWMERLSRKACAEMGAVAAACKAPRTGREIKDHGILYSTSKAIRIGRVVAEARRRREEPSPPSSRRSRVHCCSRARCRTSSGARPRAFCAARPGSPASTAIAARRSGSQFQNEYAAGWRDGEVMATTPDIICTMDSESGEAIGTEMLRYGQRISVIALPAPELFLTPKGLATVGPRAFGYDFDYRAAFAG